MLITAMKSTPDARLAASASGTAAWRSEREPSAPLRCPGRARRPRRRRASGSRVPLAVEPRLEDERHHGPGDQQYRDRHLQEEHLTGRTVRTQPGRRGRRRMLCRGGRSAGSCASLASRNGTSAPAAKQPTGEGAARQARIAGNVLHAPFLASGRVRQCSATTGPTTSQHDSRVRATAWEPIGTKHRHSL